MPRDPPETPRSVQGTPEGGPRDAQGSPRDSLGTLSGRPGSPWLDQGAPGTPRTPRGTRAVLAALLEPSSQEPAASDQQPTSGVPPLPEQPRRSPWGPLSTQPGPVECAEQLNPLHPAISREQCVSRLTEHMNFKMTDPAPWHIPPGSPRCTPHAPKFSKSRRHVCSTSQPILQKRNAETSVCIAYGTTCVPPSRPRSIPMRPLEPHRAE